MRVSHAKCVRVGRSAIASVLARPDISLVWEKIATNTLSNNFQHEENQLHRMLLRTVTDYLWCLVPGVFCIATQINFVQYSDDSIVKILYEVYGPSEWRAHFLETIFAFVALETQSIFHSSHKVPSAVIELCMSWNFVKSHFMSCTHVRNGGCREGLEID